MEKLSENNLETKTGYIKFVDTDKYNTQLNKQVGDSIHINGKVGETISLNIKVPKNYKTAKNYNLPTEYTFLENHKNVLVIPVIHKKKIEEIKIKRKRTIHYKIAAKDEVVKNLNDGSQQLEFAAQKITDLLTGKVYYDWQKNQDNYSSVTTPTQKGYYASRIQADDQQISIEEIIADHDKADEDISIVYRPLGCIIQQDMDGTELARFNYRNSSDPTKAAEIPLPASPEGYQAVSSLPEKIIPSDPEADIVLTYQPNKKSQFRKVTRMITEIQANGHKKTRIQEVEFENVAGQWKLAPGTKRKWNIITPDVPEGYTIASVKKTDGEDYEQVVKSDDEKILAIDAVKPNFDTANEDITIFIKPSLHYIDIDFIDVNNRAKNKVKSIPLIGRTDEQVEINLTKKDFPAGYKLVSENIPQQYGFKAKYNSHIVILVEKNKVQNKSTKIRLY